MVSSGDRDWCSPSPIASAIAGAIIDDHRRVGDRYEINEPGPIREPIGDVPDNAQGEASLANPAGPHRRDQPVRTQRFS
jgi:hypothetical protein